MARMAVGGFVGVWSPRILEEWRRAALRDGGVDADLEVAALRRRFPDAEVVPDRVSDLYLPDPNDVHVLEAAITAGAEEILTFNSKDFPTTVLATYGVIRRHPDEFLLEQYHSDPTGVRDDVAAVLLQAAGHGIDVSRPRALFKRARLPRFGKALDQG